MNIERLEELNASATPAPWESAWAAQRLPIAVSNSTIHEGKAFGLYGGAMQPKNTDIDIELCAELRNALPEIIASEKRLAALDGTLCGPALVMAKMIVADEKNGVRPDSQTWDALLFCARQVIADVSK